MTDPVSSDGPAVRPTAAGREARHTAAGREARLADALRDNLRRRKAQARGRAADADPPVEPEAQEQ